ncbi:hypothetical protein BGZ50_007033 [Haplosporangium sp. Z 11]|nr:hypothetical protein BGZ50_007033 [Haplosporangium sp. Z 11]
MRFILSVFLASALVSAIAAASVQHRQQTSFRLEPRHEYHSSHGHPKHRSHHHKSVSKKHRRDLHEPVLSATAPVIREEAATIVPAIPVDVKSKKASKFGSHHKAQMHGKRVNHSHRYHKKASHSKHKQHSKRALELHRKKSHHQSEHHSHHSRHSNKSSNKKRAIAKGTKAQGKKMSHHKKASSSSNIKLRRNKSHRSKHHSHQQERDLKVAKQGKKTSYKCKKAQQMAKKMAFKVHNM